MSSVNTNDLNIAEIVRVIKYVDISFYVNSETETYHLIPNTILDVPVKEPTYQGIINNKRSYNVCYDWQHNNISHPILVPNVNTTYQALLLNLTIPTCEVHILSDSNDHQRMGAFYNLDFEYPLYFKATTVEVSDNIIKEVLVDPVYVINQDNTYTHQLNFNISDVSLMPGASKDYIITLELYKDLLKTIYLGRITINAIISSTVSPGD